MKDFVDLPKGCKVASSKAVKALLDEGRVKVYLIDLDDGEVSTVTRTSKRPSVVWHLPPGEKKEQHIATTAIGSYLMFTEQTD